MTEASGRYKLIALSDESTVVAEYVPDAARDNSYQSEDGLEKELIKRLEAQAYEYLPITSDADLTANLRRQLENSFFWCSFRCRPDCAD